MNKSDTTGELAAALAKAQGEMTFAAKDATNPHFKSRYADLAAIVDAIRVPLSKNGLSYSQLCDFNETGALIVETVLMHSSGEWISGKLFMPVPQQTPQGIGSALTYAKRYSLAAIIGIAADEDDDGEAAMGRGHTATTKPPVAVSQSSGAQTHGQLSPEQTKYFPRAKAALDTLFGDDVAAKKAKIKELTTFTGKDDKTVPGVEDYRKLDGKRLEILTHKIEKEAESRQASPLPEVCAECGEPRIDGACRNVSCPEGKPTEDDPF